MRQGPHAEIRKGRLSTKNSLPRILPDLCAMANPRNLLSKAYTIVSVMSNACISYPTHMTSRQILSLQPLLARPAPYMRPARWRYLQLIEQWGRQPGQPAAAQHLRLQLIIDPRPCILAAQQASMLDSVSWGSLAMALMAMMSPRGARQG